VIINFLGREINKEFACDIVSAFKKYYAEKGTLFISTNKTTTKAITTISNEEKDDEREEEDTKFVVASNCLYLLSTLLRNLHE
jgi:hypothetical protein